eukprot:TRINITY_DN1147_c0_g1_i4.p1 TRINITY_DN1147_c0_g1~~TRINITY_DN1147_c0_g1_i4.p1  ORF type:complete len:172 (-),score=35.40 TRINITY_DN1147_c0_g1_i4:47-562(-)
MVMESLGLKKYSVLGWSDGGNTSCILSAMYPESVDKMVIWGSNPTVTKEEMDVYNSLRDTTTWNPKMREPLVEMYGEAYFQMQWEAWVDAYQRFYNATVDGDIYQRELEKILCPTLIIHGEQDKLVPVVHPQRLHEGIHNSQVEYWRDAGHSLHLKYADKFNQRVRDFLLD